MPKINLPGKIFKKDFDRYYLFDYHSEFLRNNFFQKLSRIESILNSNKITISCIDINLVFKYNWNDNTSFMKFLKSTRVKDQYEVNSLDLLLNEFYIKGETSHWEIYGFEIDDILILGISNSIQQIIEDNLNPYIKKTAKHKLELISWMFGEDESKKEKFVNEMNNLYNFY